MNFQVLPMPARTLAWWRDEKEEIDFDPVYQRKGHVWSERQKQYLIDSLINNFDVPKLYLADFTFLNNPLNKSNKKYAVIDGKQRLLAIFDFFEDQLKLPKGFVFGDDPALQLGGMTYSDLQVKYPKISRRFDNASLTVMSVITADETKINELFVRLNSSKPLSGAEVRNAMLGTLPGIIRDISGHEFFTSRIKFGTARSQDRNLAAKLLLLEHRGTIVDTKKSQIDALLFELEDAVTDIDRGAQEADIAQVQDALVEASEDAANTDIDRAATRVATVLDKLASVFRKADPLLRQQAQIVVIYWLARDLLEAELPKLRPFLMHFDEQRMAQHVGAIEDAELADYELMARTSNDAYSIRFRDQVLRARFVAYAGRPAA